ncbi:MAG: redoxin domain-containing protein [Alistipes sp.]|nr:redoxin domain-containing protein [Alistipes sp.]
MKRVIFAIAMMVGVVSCATDANKCNTTISGRFVGSCADSIFLERVSDSFAEPTRVAAVRLEDNGAFRFELAIEEDASPRFYRISNNHGSRPVTLVVAPEDDITLESVGDIFLNYEVEGSEESALIREFNREYFKACDRLALIAEGLGTRASYNEREAYLAAQQAIQAQMRFVGSHTNSLAAIYAMRHSVAEQYIPQLDGHGISVVHYRAVLDGVSKRYPDSPYIAIVEREIAEVEAMIDLVGSVQIASYPDIELEDMYKVKHKLSELDGKVVLLYFWTLESALCNNINAELKELYAKYKEQGFEVYHISADSDIAVWIEAVRQQQHPWISLYGGNSMDVFTLYNVSKLPTAYLIDRNGDMSVAPLNMTALERELRRAL